MVKVEGPPYLCKSDEVGELCISSGATGSAYWGLAGKTNHTFKVTFLPTYLPPRLLLIKRPGIVFKVVGLITAVYDDKNTF